MYGLDAPKNSGAMFWAQQEPAGKKIAKRQEEYRMLEQAVSDRGLQAPVLPSIGGSPRAPPRVFPKPIAGMPKSAWASPSKMPPGGDSPYVLPAGAGGPHGSLLPMPKVGLHKLL
jgi:hypothetical protein